MLKTLTLENFKAFGHRTEIELAPITLIFGQNSAGKSSILQSLNLLKQTYQTPNSDAALLPRVEGGFSDLGSFNELLFDHDTSRQLRIGLRVTEGSEQVSRRAYRRVMQELQELEVPRIEIGFQRPSPTSDVSVSDIKLFNNDDIHLVTFAVSQISESERTATNRKHRVSNRYHWMAGARLIGRCTEVTKNDSIWNPIYKAWFKHREYVVDQLVEMLGAAKQEFDWEESEASASKQKVRIRRMRRLSEEQISSAIKFYSSEFSQDEFVDRFTEIFQKQKIPIHRFLPADTVSTFAGYRGIPELEARTSPFSHPDDDAPELPLLDVRGLAAAAGGTAAHVLGTLFPMGPWRKPPERWYGFTGTSPRDVGYQGEHLPDLLFRNRRRVKEANKWLEKLKIGYQLDVRRLGEGDTDLFEVRLIDAHREADIEVALADVGYGISQILPFIVQSLASQQQIISIEQPEVHIHPGLQADLGELIVAATQPPYNHQFLVETHSEHLILRIQKLIRDGAVSADDVSVLFVSRGPHGSTVQRLRLDDSGDFSDDWPGGFFSERLQELR